MVSIVLSNESQPSFRVTPPNPCNNPRDYTSEIQKNYAALSDVESANISRHYLLHILVHICGIKDFGLAELVDVK